eukprot:7378016-Prymnesium_polylepis.1
MPAGSGPQEPRARGKGGGVSGWPHSIGKAIFTRPTTVTSFCVLASRWTMLKPSSSATALSLRS